MEPFLNFLTFKCGLLWTQLTLLNVPAIQSYYGLSLSHPPKWQNEPRSPSPGLAPDFCSPFHEPTSAQEQRCRARAGPRRRRSAVGRCRNSDGAELTPADSCRRSAMGMQVYCFLKPGEGSARGRFVWSVCRSTSLRSEASLYALLSWRLEAPPRRCDRNILMSVFY